MTDDTLPVFDEAFWDTRYASVPAIWSGRPNPQLVAEVAGMRVGRVVDIGCGEGADAIWLSSQGWRVTAVDFSQVALDRAAVHADAAGQDLAARITWVHADLGGEVVLPSALATANLFDLVSAQFFHALEPQRPALHARLATLVAPGGTLLVVGHHPVDLELGIGRPARAALLFPPEEVAASLDPTAWTIEVCEARPRTTVGTDGTAGEQVTAHDSVLRARRRD